MLILSSFQTSKSKHTACTRDLKTVGPADTLDPWVRPFNFQSASGTSKTEAQKLLTVSLFGLRNNQSRSDSSKPTADKRQPNVHVSEHNWHDTTHCPYASDVCIQKGIQAPSFADISLNNSQTQVMDCTF